MEKFPKMENLIDNLNSKDRSLVTIIDPHIKAKEDYEIALILRKNSKYKIKLILNYRLFSENK